MWGMWAVIATEAMLFVCMFGAYYYLGSNKDRWAKENPSPLHYPLILLVILLTSSIVLCVGREAGEAGALRRRCDRPLDHGRAGHRFPGVQGFEYCSQLGGAGALQQLLRIDLLHHHQPARGARDCRAADADVCRRPAAVREGSAAHRTRPTRPWRFTGTLSMWCGSSSSCCFTSFRISRCTQLMADSSNPPERVELRAA